MPVPCSSAKNLFSTSIVETVVLLTVRPIKKSQTLSRPRATRWISVRTCYKYKGRMSLECILSCFALIRRHNMYVLFVLHLPEHDHKRKVLGHMCSTANSFTSPVHFLIHWTYIEPSASFSNHSQQRSFERLDHQLKLL